MQHTPKWYITLARYAQSRAGFAHHVIHACLCCGYNTITLEFIVAKIIFDPVSGLLEHSLSPLLLFGLMYVDGVVSLIPRPESLHGNEANRVVYL